MNDPIRLLMDIVTVFRQYLTLEDIKSYNRLPEILEKLFVKSGCKQILDKEESMRQISLEAQKMMGEILGSMASSQLLGGFLGPATTQAPSQDYDSEYPPNVVSPRDKERLKACRSESEWNKVYSDLCRRNNGKEPDDWIDEVIITGLRDDVFQKWE